MYIFNINEIFLIKDATEKFQARTVKNGTFIFCPKEKKAGRPKKIKTGLQQSDKSNTLQIIK